MSFDLVVSGGTAVLPEGTRTPLISRSRTARSPRSAPALEGDRTIDATGQARDPGRDRATCAHPRADVPRLDAGRGGLAAVAGGGDARRAVRRDDDGRLVRVHGRARRRAGVRRRRRSRPPARGLHRPLVHGLRLPPGPDRLALGRDDRERRRRDRRRHGDDEALHHRPDDRPGGDPHRQRLGARGDARVRGARRDGDGPRRGRRPDQVLGGEADPRGPQRPLPRARRAHAARRGARGTDDGAARAGGGRAALHRPRRRARADGRDRRAARGRPARLRRGAAQPALLLDRRLRQAGRLEVPHRHGPEATGAPAGALGRACGRPPLDDRHRRVHDLVRRQDGGLRPPDDARRPCRHRDARRDRLLRRRREGAADARAVRRRLGDEPGADPRHVSAEGRARGRERRRHLRLGSRRAAGRSRSTSFTTTATTAPGRAGR